MGFDINCVGEVEGDEAVAPSGMPYVKTEKPLELEISETVLTESSTISLLYALRLSA